MASLFKAVRNSVPAISIVADATNLPRTASHGGNKLKIVDVDMIVTSPPIHKRDELPMFNRYELLILELISQDGLIKHQEQYIGTERVYSKDFKSLKSFSFAGVTFPF